MDISETNFWIATEAIFEKTLKPEQIANFISNGFEVAVKKYLRINKIIRNKKIDEIKNIIIYREDIFYSNLF